MKRTHKTDNGKPIFGATLDEHGTNFAIFSRNAQKVIIELYKNFYDGKPYFRYELDPDRNKTGDVWHIFIDGVKENIFYGWRMDGPYEPENGHRFNINKLLLDPYSRAVSGTFDYEDAEMYSYDKKNREGEDITFSTIDDAQVTCKSIIINEDGYNWERDVHPKTPYKDTIIYEMHARLFTMNPNSNVEKRGTFLGLLEKIRHLKDLGITAVELLPIFEFNLNSVINRNPFTGEKLKDVWGYNPINFFAVTGNYSCGLRLGEQVYQFKDFVKAMHKAGIEVLLDVVYNHTGEGNEYGPTLSFKGQDNTVFYILEQNNKRYYSNYSGTGNTLNCSHAVVKQMIIDSLRYWVTEMHVDGFRFDLAAILGRANDGRWIGDVSLLKDIVDDPILSGTKLIAEGWDAAGGYFVGEFPAGWAEWNGKYRDTARQFIRGDQNTISDLATRIVGSPDLFSKFGRKPYHSINFITAHDGFTMWDLVSYNRKHNFINGEGNNDGDNHNSSYNHGNEGDTVDSSIIKLRERQVKNFVTLLMMSQGVPMILMGDEFCRTQFGNNNTYCQDNEMTWVDWDRKKQFKGVHRFFQKIIKFRKEHHSLKREHFFTANDLSGNGVADITWHGVNSYQPDWSDCSHTLAFMISGEDFTDKKTPEDNDIYVALNSYWEPLEFELPVIKGKKWYRIVDTFKKSPEDFLDEPELVEGKYKVMNKSCVVMISKKV